ncbi:MAG: hypothetical protein ACU0FH_08855 [Heliomarina sp.]|uniref:hypothetical protein n=1 Tax=Heliomarina sp. TaxID=2917556 RepID=UPI004057F632
MDLNPIALLSSAAGLSLTVLRLSNPKVFELMFQVLENKLDAYFGRSSLVPLGASHISEIESVVLSHYSGCLLNDICIPIMQRPNEEALTPWYDIETLSRIIGLSDYLKEELGAGPVSLVAHTMISACLRQLCSQNQSWGHIADNVKPRELKPKDVYRSLRDWLVRVKNRLKNLSYVGPGVFDAKFKITRANWDLESNPTPPGGFDLLVTSPPYAGAIDYALSQRLSLYYMGYADTEISTLVGAEIGARRKRSKTTHISTWAEQVAKTAGHHDGYANAGSHAAYVFPHKDSGRELGEEKIILEMESKGWNLEVQFDRSIRQARARHAWTSIKKETILVFGR